MPRRCCRPRPSPVAVKLWVASNKDAGGEGPGPTSVRGGCAELAWLRHRRSRAPPAAAVPVSVRVLFLVMPSPTVPLSVENEAIVGAPGATVSTVTLRGRILGSAGGCPGLSLAVALKLWVAPRSTPVVNVQAPLPFAVAVPKGRASRRHRRSRCCWPAPFR